MSPYPTSQMHSVQKRGMYPMGHHHQMPPSQNVPGGGPMYQHNQPNYAPLHPQMHQGYIRPGPMNNYGRVPSGMMSQQRPMAPQYMPQGGGPAVTASSGNNMMGAGGHQSQYGYNHPNQNPGMNQVGYQNVQG